MGETRNCKICGRVFEGNEFVYVCAACKEKDEAEFEKIRSYLYEHPGASIYEVSSVLDISINKLKHFLREGRLEILENNNSFLSCTICGVPIHTGLYCEVCGKQSKHGYQSTYNETNEKNAQKINYLSRKKK